MSDYIEREAAQSAVWEEDNQTDMILAIGSLPAADVAPVRHGRWIDSSNGQNIANWKGSWMCSECEQDNTYDKPYCPNCGALMDGKEDSYE